MTTTHELHATDGLRLSTTSVIHTYRERHQREAIPEWDNVAALRRVGMARAIQVDGALALQRGRYAGDHLERLGRLELTRRAVDEGILAPTSRAEGRNKVTLVGIAALLASMKGGTQYKIAFVDMGSSSQAAAEGDTGCVTHVDASAGIPRATITELIVDGKILRTSTFLTTADYNDVTIREACLFDALTGGTAYNRVLYDTPLAKVSTDTAVANIDHQLTN